MMLLVLMMTDGVVFYLVLGVVGVGISGVLWCLIHVTSCDDNKSWLVAFLGGWQMRMSAGKILLQGYEVCVMSDFH